MHTSDLHAHGPFHHLLESRAQSVAHVVFNRPASLNALSKGMMDRLADLIQEYAEDPKISCIMLSGRGDRAFCAGGDLRAVYNAHQKNDLQSLSRLFAREYTYNLRLHALTKPHISFIHGIVMGGGVGASVHGSHRIMCETTTLAMPETGIGYFPDVGASHIFHKAPGHLGMYLALTGARITAADALYCGFGTHYIPFHAFSEVEKALLEKAPSTKEEVDALLAPFVQEPPASPLKEYQPLIDACFDGDRVEDILARLKENPHPFAQQTHALLLTRSPLSLLVTFAYLKRTRGMTFADTMALEYTLSQHFVRGHDFIEGIRAAVIDKDKAPKWGHGHISQVSQDEIDTYFDPTPHETHLPFPCQT